MSNSATIYLYRAIGVNIRKVASGRLFRSAVKRLICKYFQKEETQRSYYISKFALSLFIVHFGVQLSQLCADEIWRLCVPVVHGWTWMVHDNLHRIYDTCCCYIQNMQRRPLIECITKSKSYLWMKTSRQKKLTN